MFRPLVVCFLCLVSCLVWLAVGERPIRAGQPEVPAVSEGSEQRAVPPFTDLEIESGLRATVVYGTQQRVTLRGALAVLSGVVTEVKGNRLNVHWKEASARRTDSVQVQIAAPRVTAVVARGGSEVRVAEVAGESLMVELRGGSLAAIDGQVRALQVRADGGSKVYLGNLTAAAAQVELREGAHGYIKASQEVSGSLSSGAKLVVLKQPHTRRIKLSGGAKVKYE